MVSTMPSSIRKGMTESRRKGCYCLYGLQSTGRVVETSLLPFEGVIYGITFFTRKCVCLGSEQFISKVPGE
jgi:hypothetical protein